MPAPTHLCDEGSPIDVRPRPERQTGDLGDGRIRALTRLAARDTSSAEATRSALAGILDTLDAAEVAAQKWWLSACSTPARAEAPLIVLEDYRRERIWDDRDGVRTSDERSGRFLVQLRLTDGAGDPVAVPARRRFDAGTSRRSRAERRLFAQPLRVASRSLLSLLA